MQDIKNILDFLNQAEKLKSTLRHSWLSSGRQESTAEHSWRMTLMALVFADYFPDFDIKRVMEIIIIHDLAEALVGDSIAFKESSPEKKQAEERKAMLRLAEKLNAQTKDKILNLCDEYNACQTNESKLAKAIDKLETLIQHNEADVSTWEEVEHEFNLTYGQKYMQFSDFIKKFRSVVDEITKSKSINKA